jgi:6-phosphofructokinase 1
MKRIGVLTSGGDAPGMNAAVRSVVRTAISKGLEVCAIYEGYEGMLEGGDRIKLLGWRDVGGILQKGGTIIGSARCARFRERNGRLLAAHNLIKSGIEGLIIIGGDGSLTGAHILQKEWPSLVEELRETGQISDEVAAAQQAPAIVGLIGSIDNDMHGTEMTIGADTALHRIVEAVDAITSTAASHQRSFVVEVMGRRCGYLALMGALATGSDWALIPECPPDGDDWESKMCAALKAGREAGRRDSIVIVAEGAQDRHGNPITSQHIKHILEDRLDEDTRITVLGHVQRGGSPSAYDRNLSTRLGYDAVDALLTAEAAVEPIVVGVHGNMVTRTPLTICLEKTWEVADAIKTHDYERAMALRGGSFGESFTIARTLLRVFPSMPKVGRKRLRVGVIHAGGPAPGMNTAVRAAVRLGLDKGFIMYGIQNGFRGFVDGKINEMDWMSVGGYASMGGAELGTNRYIPQKGDFYAIAQNIEKHQLDGLIMIGGLSGYQSVIEMTKRRDEFPAFDMPIICMPATINNNLPGTDLSVGADTALNSIVEAVGKIKQSAVASQRTFIVEVMGNYCGYLAMMSAMATGAERVYLHEEGVTLNDLAVDVARLSRDFRRGKRLGLIIRNEKSNEIYTTSFMHALFKEEGQGLFDVRQAILGHMQQGGDPSPFDRIFATRLASRCVNFVEKNYDSEEKIAVCVGQTKGKIKLTFMDDVPRNLDAIHLRPKKQWWMQLREIARVMAQSEPINQ